jgi:pyruvate ferredoxin oxidoreductase delta subunit
MSERKESQQTPELELSWEEVSRGGIVDQPGSSVTYITGTWRTMRPLRDHNQCTQCLICWIMCPDSAIPIEEGNVKGFDYAHCKGCGICAEQCPVNVKEPHCETGEMGKVIQMVSEGGDDEGA